MADIFELFRKISPQSRPKMAPVSFVVAGLGNPGPKYADTRHNAGFIAIDAIAEGAGVKIERMQFKSLTAQCEIEGVGVLLIKPMTYMNLSGEAVAEALRFYKLSPQSLIVLSDDVNLDTGRLRIRERGSDGGQKGLRSIIEHLGDDGFCRIRLGVGAKPHGDYDMADWVLSRFSDDEKKKMDAAAKKCREALPLIIAGETKRAMDQYNGHS